jgi:hypothetical protein
VAVENASYRWAYAVLTYALLVDVMYRGLVLHEAAWDLLALVVVGGGICTAYQGRQKTLAHGWVMKAVLGAVIAAVIAFVAAVLTRTP